MKNEAAPPPVIKRRKGLALVTVLSMMALITIILLAFLTTADTEFKSTKISSDGETARQLAENATSLVIGQIQAGSRQEGNVRKFHATQPGVIRQYSETGAFFAGYKLYSDATMTVTTPGVPGEAALYNDSPPSNWNTLPERYVDLNEPVVRAQAGSTALTVFFPIADPRAAGGSEPVEGFQIFNQSKLGTGESINGVVNTGTDDNKRVPMPVEWIYVLRDGTMGTLSAANIFTAAGGSGPSQDNPIIGRIAFWTDDESCKVNINTASEPAYWAPPFFYSQRDQEFNDAPPVQFEYQRYPGHPATVALSSILYPGNNMDIYSLTDATQREEILSLRERIYELAPKVNMGGSRGGTRPYDPDSLISDQAPPILAENVLESLGERLYISLDELRFSEAMSGRKRSPNSLLSPVGAELLTTQKLERSRFFLTANSRAPEFSIFGVPRVAMWPIPVPYQHPELGLNQTAHDKHIAFCASIRNSSGSHLYAFQRENAHSQLADIMNPRNAQLMNYLYSLMGKVWPGTSQGGGKAFAGAPNSSKYGEDDSRQILVSMFDYIRSTNLYDSELSLEGKEIREKATGDTEWGQNNLKKYTGDTLIYLHKNNLLSNWTKIYEYRDTLRNSRSYITYTEPHYKTERNGDGTSNLNNRSDDNMDAIKSGLPGHGQVSPSRWVVGNKVNEGGYQGFGRTVTISEVGLHFICTADGANDEGSFRNWRRGPGGLEKSNHRSGGRTAPIVNFQYDYEINRPVRYLVERFRSQGDADLETAYWYSNYPPFPDKDSREIIEAYGINPAATDEDDPLHPRNHPGFDPRNWNLTLDDSMPLKTNEKRIQVLLQVELFCPAVGWTGFDPEYTLVLDGRDLSGIEIEGEALFSTTTDAAIKSGKPTYSAEFSGAASQAQRQGGFASFRSISEDRRARTIRRVSDVGYDTSASTQIHGKLTNLDLMSSFKTLDVDKENGNFQFQVKRPLKFRIYDTHDWTKAQPIQNITVNFPTEESTVPIPGLITISSPHRRTVDSEGAITLWSAVQAPRFWCFNYSGCVRRFDGSSQEYVDGGNPTPVAEPLGIGGRLRSASFNQGIVPGSNRGSTQFQLPLRYYLPNNDPDYGKAPLITVAGMDNLIFGWTLNSGNGYQNNFYKSSGRAIDRGTDGKEYLNDPSQNFGFDVVRSVIPRFGDYRLIASRRTVPGEMWVRHPLWVTENQNIIMAHNLSAYRSSSEPGFDRSGFVGFVNANDAESNKPDRRLTVSATYATDKIPDVPHFEETAWTTNRYRDWDNSIADGRDGPYINKPDEGNFAKFYYWVANDMRALRAGYLYESRESSSGSPSFYTPNRMISSPVMFGSLPTGVWGSNPPAAIPRPSEPERHDLGVPWRTLLFRPHTPPGATTSAVLPGIQGTTTHPGADSPADHYLLDLFWMPVVEPYAISEPLSTAGKINVNYQILPFSHIKRATGLHALLKGELMAAVPRKDAAYYKRRVTTTNGWPLAYWPEYTVASNAGTGEEQKRRSFYRRINADETVKFLDERFAGAVAGKQGLLRSASQFCEIHLVPQDAGAGVDNYSGKNVAASSNSQTRIANMNTFWEAHSLTGDNLRERPYSNIYSRITTRSNTFRVFIRAQTIAKARSSGVSQIDSNVDKVTAEYRGSRLLERYIDPTNTTSGIPDYASAGNPYDETRLEEFYRFRILEAKRFDP